MRAGAANRVMVVVLAVLLAAATAAAVVWWPRDPTVRVPGFASAPSEAWTIEMRGGVVYPIDERTIALIGNSTGRQYEVWLVDGATGRDRWRVTITGTITESLIRDLPGTGAVAVQEGTRVYLLDKSDGRIRGDFEVPLGAWFGSSDSGHYYLIDDGSLYLTVTRLGSADPSDVVWATSRRPSLDAASGWFRLVERNGFLFIGDDSPSSHPWYYDAVALSDGHAPSWVDDDVLAIWLSGDVAVIAESSSVETVDLRDGSLAWRSRADAQLMVANDRAVYEVFADSIRRRGPLSGTVAWSTPLPHEVSDAVDVGPYLVLLDRASESRQRMVVLDAERGAVLASGELPVSNWLPTAGDGRLLVLDTMAWRESILTAVTIGGERVWERRFAGTDEVTVAGPFVVVAETQRIVGLR